MKTNTILPLDFEDCYKLKTDIFDGDTPQIAVLKHIINDHLTHNERIIFLIYTECMGNYKQIQKYIHVDSRRNLYTYICNVKQKIKNLYEQHSN